MKKILYVATVVKTHIMQFHTPFLKMCKEMGWSTAVAARNDYNTPQDCVIPYCDEYYDVPFERSPFRTGNVKAYAKLKNIIENGNYDIIHCHTPVGGVLGRLAARKTRKKGTRVIYTAHGFHFFKGAPLKNWLLYYPIEKICSRFTDVLITINHEDYELAKKKMKAKRVEYVPGVGIDVKKFAETQVDRAAKRRELGIPEDAFLILSVGELIPRKNHIVLIEAVATLINDNHLNDIHYGICGQGVLDHKLKEHTEKLGIVDNVHFLGYRNDIAEICKCCDLFAFPSLQEGLPVALLEAMACGLPVVCSNIRGNRDLVEDGKNGYTTSCTNIEEIACSISRIMGSREIRMVMEQNGRSIVSAYDLHGICTIMRKIYNENSSRS